MYYVLFFLVKFLNPCGIANTTFGEINIYSLNYVKNSWVWNFSRKTTSAGTIGVAQEGMRSKF